MTLLLINHVLTFLDLEQRNNSLYEKGIELDIKNRENDLSLREIVIELKDNIIELIDNEVEGYKGYPYNSIFSMVMTNFRKRGMSASTLRRLYNIFSTPEMSDFRYNINKKNGFFYTELARQYAEQKQVDLDISTEKAAEDIEINDAILILENNKESYRVKEYIKRHAQELERKEIHQRRLSQEAEKIKIPLPQWVDQSQGGNKSMTFDALVYFRDIIENCANRVFQYPPNNEEDDRYYYQGIMALARTFEPGSDLKFTRDLTGYFDIGYESDTQSVHSAKSKSIIITPSGQERKMTREQVPVVRNRYWIVASDIVNNLPGVTHFQDYLRRHQKPYVNEGHVARHDKLSESAFGNSSLDEI